ncbi:MAG: hypothetical protein RLZZ350_1582 [Verrucomicrobiota bacterium]|jgi:epoxide hydrolase-like predicted phosphatase
MKKPTTVIFDLGGVFVNFDYGIAARAIAAQSAVTAAQVRELIDHSPLLRRYETGSISTGEFFDEVVAATGFRRPLLEFTKHFNSIFWLVPETVALNRELRLRGVPTFALSNTNPLAYAALRAEYDFFKDFDGIVVSHLARVMKPDAGIYELTEKLCGKTGADLVFIDDRADNCAAAAARGWQVIQHTSPAATRAELVRLGLL